MAFEVASSEAPPRRPLNKTVEDFLAGKLSSLAFGPDASASVEAILVPPSSDVPKRPMNERVGEALLGACQDGTFGPDATANVRELFKGTQFEGKI